MVAVPMRQRRLKRKDKARYFASRACFDCSVDVYDIGHYYMVHDHVWALTNLGENNGLKLCLRCLASRVGRPLRLDDFKSEFRHSCCDRAAILDAVLDGAILDPVGEVPKSGTVLPTTALGLSFAKS